MRQEDAIHTIPAPEIGTPADSIDTVYPVGPIAGPADDFDMIPYLLEMVQVEEKRTDFLMRVVIPLGAALVQETDFNHLLERIVTSAMTMSRADGGALYLCDENESLRTALYRRHSLGVALGGTGAQAPAFAAVAFNNIDAEHTRVPIAARAAALGKSVCEFWPTPQPITDTDPASALRFDQSIGFEIHSALAIPLRDSAGKIAGVLELSNAHRDGNLKPVPFETAIQRAVEALSLLAAAALQSYVKQQQLKDQVRELRVQVDGVKKIRQVEAIVRSDYFQNLKARAKDLRATTQAD